MTTLWEIHGNVSQLLVSTSIFSTLVFPAEKSLKKTFDFKETSFSFIEFHHVPSSPSSCCLFSDKVGDKTPLKGETKQLSVDSKTRGSGVSHPQELLPQVPRRIKGTGLDLP